MNKFYITTTLPYVNAKPHIGFATEIVRADSVARLHELLGEEVFFNTGTDEHGQKIYEMAQAAKQTPKEYTDEWAAKFDKLRGALNLSYNNFIRTTDEHHIKAAQEFWKHCEANGDIYLDRYEVKYCVGCELEKTDSELVDGRCPLHPKTDLELRQEENYFFRFSKYQDRLLALYKEQPDFIVPSFRLEEMKKFVSGGLTDFSISRLKAKMPWGVEVPGNNDHVMYVWFDALVNYISAIGWPDRENEFKGWWPGTQIAGKDNLRQQTAMWQAMLMSAGLPNSKQIFVEGFVTAEGGIKMSKSLGNVIDPIEYVEKYGTDAVRYYVLAKLSAYEDSPISQKLFEDAYTSDLVNGLGNLVARVSALAEKSHQEYQTSAYKIGDNFFENIRAMVGEFRFSDALAEVWGWIAHLDNQISTQEPWKLSGEQLKEILSDYIDQLQRIATGIEPFLPETAEEIKQTFTSGLIKKSKILFPRLQ